MGKRLRNGRAALAMTVALALFAGCDQPDSGPAVEETAREVTLAPIPRGGETPTYVVTETQSWWLGSPAVATAASTPRLGSAVVVFARVAVELELHGGRARLRCVRPKGATELEALSICTFSGAELGRLDIDQEITLEGFFAGRAGICLELAAPPTAATDETGTGPATAAPPARLRARVRLAPLARMGILNHSPRSLTWSDLNGDAVEVKSQDRTEMRLDADLSTLRKSELTAADLRENQLYSTPDEGVYFLRDADLQLIVLSSRSDEAVTVPLGDQTLLEIPAPGGRVELQGRWQLERSALGRWAIHPDYDRDGQQPLLTNRGTTAVLWKNLVTLAEIEIPGGTWRRLNPVP